MPRKTPLPTGEPLNDWRVVPAEKRRLVLESLRQSVFRSINAAGSRRDRARDTYRAAEDVARRYQSLAPTNILARGEYEDRAADNEEDNARAFHRALEALAALADNLGGEEMSAARALIGEVQP
jgi:hypothetical protein